MTEQEVLTEQHGAVLSITLNRPKARNAATAGMAQRMAQIIDEFEADDNLFVAILTGAEQTFCSGMDLKGFMNGERPSIPGRGFLALTQQPPKKPMIAAVEGYALAGGFETMLACDLVVAAETAKFGIPEVKRGLVAAAGGLLELPSRTHRAIAMEMALTGAIYDAEFGYRNGFVNRLTTEGDAFDEALRLAQEIASNGPLAVQTSKKIITESTAWDETEKFTKQSALVEPVFSSEDAKEGVAAFTEKRAPRWAAR